MEAGSGIPARERTGRDGRTLLGNDGGMRSFPVDQATLFRDDPPAPIKKKTRGKKALSTNSWLANHGQRGSRGRQC